MATSICCFLSKNAACIVVIATCSLTTPYTLADCREILESGIRNTYSLNRGGDFRRSFSSGFCSSNMQSGKSSSGGGIDVTIPVDGFPLGLGGNYSQKDAKSLQSNLCKNENGQLSDNQYEQVLRLVADPNIVSAWSACQQSQGGLLINGNMRDATNLVIELQFRNLGNVHETTLTSKPQVVGAVCPDLPWDKGTIINGSRQYAQCSRLGTSPVSFIVNSQFDGARFYIPAPEKIVLSSDNSPDEQRRSDNRGGKSPGFTVKAKVCVPTGADPKDPTVPRCPSTGSIGSACECNNPMFNGSVDTVVIDGVLRAPGERLDGTSR